MVDLIWDISKHYLHAVSKAPRWLGVLTNRCPNINAFSDAMDIHVVVVAGRIVVGGTVDACSILPSSVGSSVYRH